MPSSRLFGLTGCFALVLGFSAIPLGAAESQRPPNVIMILADDLGYGDVGCFGQQQITTPALDQLARDGMRFTQFYSGSTVCAPARNSWITGQHTGHTLIRGNVKIDLRSEDTTIAEVLRSAGYATAWIGKWGLGRIGTSGDPKARGFDHAFGYIDQSHAHNYWPSFLTRDGERVPLRNVVPDENEFGQGSASIRLDYSPDLFIEDALRFIKQERDRPFLLYFATTLPHANNEGRPHGMEIGDLGAYADRPWPEAEKGFAAMVTRLDHDVGRIVEAVDALGLGKDTLIVFTSDNGPHSEGGHDAAFFDSNGPLRGMKRQLYEGGIRSPTIVRWSERIRAGATSDLPAYFPDLFATFAELAHASDAHAPDGISLIPTLLQQGTQPSHDAMYWEFHETGQVIQAVRLGRWKAIHPAGSAAIELYDLDSDIGESHDVASSELEVVAQARAALLAGHTASARWPLPAP